MARVLAIAAMLALPALGLREGFTVDVELNVSAIPVGISTHSGGHRRRPSRAQRFAEATRTVTVAAGPDSLRKTCNYRLNKGICQVVLFQSLCSAKLGPSASRGPEKACEAVVPTGQAALLSQCVAAANDGGLQLARQRLLPSLAAEVALTAEQCEVSRLTDSFEDPSEALLVPAGDDYYTALLPDDLDEETLKYVVSMCDDLVASTVSSGLNSGFCGQPSDLGQDCTIAQWIKESWRSNYGEPGCDARRSLAVYWRCMSLRQRFIDQAKRDSSFGTAYWTSFDQNFFQQYKCKA